MKEGGRGSNAGALTAQRRNWAGLKGTGTVGADWASEEAEHQQGGHRYGSSAACTADERAVAALEVAAAVVEVKAVVSFPSRPRPQVEVARTSPCHLARRA